MMITNDNSKQEYTIST